MLTLLLATRAGAQTFPARSGELGILDVPDAEVAGRGRNHLAAELRLDRVAGQPTDFGPLPVYGVSGVTDAVDVGFTLREWGQPGDPRPARALVGVAAKLRLWRAEDLLPGLAVSTNLDRVNDATVMVGRVALSTSDDLPVRLAGFVGGELGTGSQGKNGVSVGLAASVPLSPRMHVDAEALVTPRGQNFGAALRMNLTRSTGVSLGANYLPGDEGLRVALTFGFWPPRAPREAGPAAKTAPEATTQQPLERLAFKDDRPHFRLRMPLGSPSQVAALAHRQHGTVAPRATSGAAVAAAKPAPATRAAAPSLEDLAEAQLRENEALADARERRVRSTADQLDVREKAAADEQKRLADRERDLASREKQLDTRERLIPKQPPTQQQRQLESLEAQLASQERSLAAMERSYGPALDGAEGRARDATTREAAEQQEATRLAAAATAATSRPLQIEMRKQALGAHNRQLAAFEARLVAKGEYIDAVERQLRTRAERLDAWSRRLDARGERLDGLERVGAQPQKPPATPAPPPTAPTGAATPKDKAAFVVIVKSPTAIVKERATSSASTASGPAVRSGEAVEKAVAAATVLMFPTPTSTLSELDAEALANIAKLAAREHCELLIWARAGDANTLPEAQRRATELQTRVLAMAPLDASQVVTRIMVRPGATGVNVVVSALRETAKPAQAAPAGAGAPKLQPGESGNTQLREAVQAAQASIEACAGKLLEAKRLARAEGVLKLTVGTAGRVTRVALGAGDVAGAQVEECLRAASRDWVFPAGDADYAVDVPITVIRGGAR